MDFRILNQFRVIGELGNLSRAAKELHVAQPSLSLMIRRLESELGVILLERSRRGVRLTVAGEHFARFCVDSLRQWEKVKAELHHLTSEVSGTIRLGVHPSVAIYTLANFLPRLLSDHPALHVEFVHDLSRRLLEKISAQEIDVGLIINADPRPDLVIRKLFHDEVTIFRRAKVENDDVLICDPSLSQVQALRRQMALRGIEFKRTIESSNLEVIGQLVSSGLGHAILPRRVLESLKTPFVESFPLKLTPIKDQLSLVFRTEFTKTAKGKALVGAVKKALERRA